MKKILFFLLAVVIAVTARAYWVHSNKPAQWDTLWRNYRDSESFSRFVREFALVIQGTQIKPVPISVQEAQRYVYKWVDAEGNTQLSQQEPIGVDNFEKIKLGDLDYQIEESILKKDN